jgi:hypothetical protein
MKLFFSIFYGFFHLYQNWSPVTIIHDCILIKSYFISKVSLFFRREITQYKNVCGLACFCFTEDFHKFLWTYDFLTLCHWDENKVIYFRFVSYMQQVLHLCILLFSDNLSLYYPGIEQDLMFFLLQPPLETFTVATLLQHIERLWFICFYQQNIKVWPQVIFSCWQKCIKYKYTCDGVHDEWMMNFLRN